MILGGLALVIAIALIFGLPYMPWVIGLEPTIRLFGGDSVWRMKGPDYASAMIFGTMTPWSRASLGCAAVLLVTGMFIHWWTKIRSLSDSLQNKMG